MIKSTVKSISTKNLHTIAKTIMNQINSGKQFTVAVEGNIGCGKTTLLNYFSDFPNTTILTEPVTKWRDLKGHNLLDHMYKDPARWGLTFQTYVQLTMLQAHTSQITEKVKLMERSLYSARYCFVENLFKSGKLPELEYVVLSEWFDWIINNQDVNLDLIVYLKTEPETVYKRIMERSRVEEIKIPYEYIQNLHELHEDWLINQKTFKLPAPVLVLNANPGLEAMKETYKNNSSKILGTNI